MYGNLWLFSYLGCHAMTKLPKKKNNRKFYDGDIQSDNQCLVTWPLFDISNPHFHIILLLVMFRRALLLLKKKRYQDQLLDKTENQIANLERMVRRRLSTTVPVMEKKKSRELFLLCWLVVSLYFSMSSWWSLIVSSLLPFPFIRYKTLNLPRLKWKSLRVWRLEMNASRRCMR